MLEKKKVVEHPNAPQRNGCVYARAFAGSGARMFIPRCSFAVFSGMNLKSYPCPVNYMIE